MSFSGHASTVLKTIINAVSKGSCHIIITLLINILVTTCYWCVLFWVVMPVVGASGDDDSFSCWTTPANSNSAIIVGEGSQHITLHHITAHHITSHHKPRGASAMFIFNAFYPVIPAPIITNSVVACRHLLLYVLSSVVCGLCRCHYAGFKPSDQRK